MPLPPHQGKIPEEPGPSGLDNGKPNDTDFFGKTLSQEKLATIIYLPKQSICFKQKELI